MTVQRGLDDDSDSSSEDFHQQPLDALVRKFPWLRNSHQKKRKMSQSIDMDIFFNGVFDRIIYPERRNSLIEQKSPCLKHKKCNRSKS